MPQEKPSPITVSQPKQEQPNAVLGSAVLGSIISWVTKGAKTIAPRISPIFLLPAPLEYDNFNNNNGENMR